MAFYLLCLTIFIMFFQPAYIWPALEPYQPLKNSAILAMVAFIFSSAKSKASFLSISVNRYFVLFCLFQIASSLTLWSQAAMDTFNLWLRLGIVYFLITKSVTNERKVRILSWMIVASICYLSYYSVTKFVVDYVPGSRAGGFGWYENSNDIAIILVSVIPLTLMLADMSRSKLAKFLLAGIAALFSFNLLFTGSRSGLLGLMTVGGLSMLVLNKIPAVVRSVLTVMMLIAVFSVGLVNVLGRSDLSGLHGDASSEDRKVQWRAGVKMVLDNPFLGVGRDEFVSRTEDYGGIRGLMAHNTLIQVFGETGLIGGIFFSLFSFYPLYEVKLLLREFKAKNTEYLINAYKFIAIGLVGFWVCAFFSNRYQFYILYVLVGLMLAVKQIILGSLMAERKSLA